MPEIARDLVHGGRVSPADLLCGRGGGHAPLWVEREAHVGLAQPALDAFASWRRARSPAGYRAPAASMGARHAQVAAGSSGRPGASVMLAVARLAGHDRHAISSNANWAAHAARTASPGAPAAVPPCAAIRARGCRAPRPAAPRSTRRRGSPGGSSARRAEVPACSGLPPCNRRLRRTPAAHRPPAGARPPRRPSRAAGGAAWRVRRHICSRRRRRASSSIPRVCRTGPAGQQDRGRQRRSRTILPVAPRPSISWSASLARSKAALPRAAGRSPRPPAGSLRPRSRG